MTQVITIDPNGGVSGLQVKPGRGLDLTKLGRAEIQRASEIVWDERFQAWKIKVLQKVGKGIVTPTKLADAGVDVNEVFAGEDRMVAWWDRPDAVRFSSYEDAVKVEIAYLDALRLKGQF